jgi:kynurenine formamidase
MRLHAVLFFLLAMAGCQMKNNPFENSRKKNDPFTELKKGKWIDLTWSFDEQSVYWPTNIPFKHETVSDGINDKGYYYSSFKFSAEEHGGTHFDAPMHFAQGGLSIEKVPVEQLVGDGVLVDVTDKVSGNPDYQINVADLHEWEKENGQIPDKAIVLLYTGFEKYYPDKLKYTGTTLGGMEGVADLHFPGLHPNAAQWLATDRKIKAVGLDTPSIDYGQSKDFMTHRILFANNLTAYENVANLDNLPAKGFWIIALPMKIKGGSGAPLRIVALIP